MEKYICYDGVENDVAYFDTEEKAIKHLQYLIDTALDDGEWMDGIDYCFVARITHELKSRKVPAPEEYKKEGFSTFVEFSIKEK